MAVRFRDIGFFRDRAPLLAPAFRDLLLLSAIRPGATICGAAEHGGLKVIKKRYTFSGRLGTAIVYRKRTLKARRKAAPIVYRFPVPFCTAF